MANDAVALLLHRLDCRIQHREYTSNLEPGRERGLLTFIQFFAQHLPLAEGIILFFHVFAFFVFLLVFWIMGDHGESRSNAAYHLSVR